MARGADRRSKEFRLGELQLYADEPEEKAGVLGELLGLESEEEAVQMGETVVRFVPGGPQGRPELFAEQFL